MRRSGFCPVGVHQKVVSTRLIKPTLAQLDVSVILTLVREWTGEFEMDGSVLIFDEGIAQYLLCDVYSHHKFYAALVLNKLSLRCTLIENEPQDVLDTETGNRIQLLLPMRKSLSSDESQVLENLKEKLKRRGYRF